MFKGKPKSKIEKRIKEHKDFIARVSAKYRGKKERIPAITKMWVKHAEQAVKMLEGKLKKQKAAA